jgi:hypothetical protein
LAEASQAEAEKASLKKEVENLDSQNREKSLENRHLESKNLDLAESDKRSQERIISLRKENNLLHAEKCTLSLRCVSLDRENREKASELAHAFSLMNEMESLKATNNIMREQLKDLQHYQDVASLEEMERAVKKAVDAEKSKGAILLEAEEKMVRSLKESLSASQAASDCWERKVNHQLNRIKGLESRLEISLRSPNLSTSGSSQPRPSFAFSTPIKTPPSIPSGPHPGIGMVNLTAAASTSASGSGITIRVLPRKTDEKKDSRKRFSSSAPSSPSCSKRKHRESDSDENEEEENESVNESKRSQSESEKTIETVDIDDSL